MRGMEDKLFLQLLDRDLSSVPEIGCESFMKEFGSRANRFGNEDMEPLLAIIGEPKRFQNFATILSAAGIRAANKWFWEEENSFAPHSDLRCSAYEKFCAEHEDILYDIFERNAGRPFIGKRTDSRINDCCYCVGADWREMRCLEMEIRNMASVHPTNQQTLFGFALHLLGKGGIFPEIFSDVRFPFV